MNSCESHFSILRGQSSPTTSPAPVDLTMTLPDMGQQGIVSSSPQMPAAITNLTASSSDHRPSTKSAERKNEPSIRKRSELSETKQNCDEESARKILRCDSDIQQHGRANDEVNTTVIAGFSQVSESNQNIHLKDNICTKPGPVVYDQTFEDLICKKCDIIFFFRGTNEVIGGHIKILSGKSPVFKAMFNANMREAKNRHIFIENVRPDVFKALLNYIYSGDVLNNALAACDDMVQLLFIAANQFLVDDLSKLCTQLMVDNITEDNVIEIFNFVVAYAFVPEAEKTVRRSCYHFLETHKERMAGYCFGENWDRMVKADMSLSYYPDMMLPNL